MSNVNTVTISGNCTRDPEVKHLPSGTAVAEFGLAVNRRRKGEGDDYIEEVSFFDVTVFGGFGELVGRKMKKGDPITVAGRLQQDRWETEDGQNRSKVKVIANDIDGDWQFRSKDEDNAAAATEAPAAEATEAAAEAAAPAADDDIPF